MVLYSFIVSNQSKWGYRCHDSLALFRFMPTQPPSSETIALCGLFLNLFCKDYAIVMLGNKRIWYSKWVTNMLILQKKIHNIQVLLIIVNSRHSNPDHQIRTSYFYRTYCYSNTYWNACWQNTIFFHFDKDSADRHKTPNCWSSSCFLMILDISSLAR